MKIQITRETSLSFRDLIADAVARLAGKLFTKDKYVAGWWRFDRHFETGGFIFSFGMDSESLRDDCPEQIAAAIDRYNEGGIAPGSFVRAVLENDLTAAIDAASPESLAHLPGIRQYVRAWVRAEAKGSKEAVTAWLAKKAAELPASAENALVDECPVNIREGVARYLKGCTPGGFLRAVLENDLSVAVWSADTQSLAKLPEVMAYVDREVPPRARGSRERVRLWLLARQEGSGA